MKIIYFFLLLLIHTSLFAYENEDRVICALTSKVAKFTKNNNSKLNPYTITVLHNKFGTLFTDIFKNVTINGKDVKILYIEDIKNLQKTNILFVFTTHINELNQIFSSIKDKNILTISNMRGFAQRGGMVQIYSQNQKLKIKINLKKVNEEDIYIHSALLRIASIVQGDKR